MCRAVSLRIPQTERYHLRHRSGNQTVYDCRDIIIIEIGNGGRELATFRRQVLQMGDVGRLG